jgi:hypothetical protein
MEDLKRQVSFDFDATLDRKLVQDYAFSLIKKGYEVWILTSRFEDCDNYNFKANNDDLFKVADTLGIKREHIKFMNMEEKYKFVLTKNFLFHLDDDWIEINMINSRTKSRGISCFGNSVWKQKCNRILK